MYISNILDDDAIRDQIDRKVTEEELSASLGIDRYHNKLQQVARSEMNSHLNFVKEKKQSVDLYTSQSAVSILPDIHKKNFNDGIFQVGPKTNTNRVVTDRSKLGHIFQGESTHYES